MLFLQYYFKVAPLDGLFEVMPSPGKELFRSDGRFEDYDDIGDDNSADGRFIDLNHWN